MKMFLRGRPVPMLIPDELVPTYSLDTRSELPPCKLKLDWVYPLAFTPSLPPTSFIPHPPVRRGLKSFWCGTSAHGSIFVVKTGLPRPLRLEGSG